MKPFVKRPWLLFGTVGLSAGCVVVFVVSSRLWPWSPKRGLGLGFGVFAALTFVAAMLYPARRPRARPLGSAQRWLQLHLYLSSLGVVATWIHAGLQLPSGGMGWLLVLLTLLTALSGLGGVYLQKTLPQRASEGLRTQALYERIPAHVESLCAEADERLAGTGEALDGLYVTEIRPALAQIRPRWAYLRDVRAGRETALAPLRQMAPFVPAEDKERLEDLMSLYTQKLELDAHHSIQRALRYWLWLHALPGGLLMGVLAMHILTWTLY